MFPERLRALRKGQKITLKELATHLNENLGPNEKPNTASQIGNWERGIRTPSYVEARKLAEFFDVSLDYLTGKRTAMILTLQNYSSRVKTYRLIKPSFLAMTATKFFN